MKALREYVEGFIKMPLSMILPLDRKLNCLDNDDPEKGFLFGTEEVGELYLIQSRIGSFLERAPIGYAVAGHAGSGSNSYGLIMQRRDKHQRIFFRLPIGGWYMDNKLQAKRIRKFIPAYLDFEQKIQDRVNEIIIVESMGFGKSRFTMKEGRIIEIEKSFLNNPNFEERFREALGE